LDLLEYQGKQLFAANGVPVPEGKPAKTVDEAVAAANEIGYPCAVKAQVLIGGRGKAGGIKIAQNEEEAREHADAILGMDITGPHGEGPFTVHELWVEKGSDIAEEYYASFILDRGEKKVMAMLSRMGGMDVEAIAEEDPDALVKEHVDPLKGFSQEDALAIASKAKLADDAISKTAELLVKLNDTFNAGDATLIEVNPMIVTGDRNVVALDAKVTIDNSALFRHEELAELDTAESIEDPQERMAKEKELTYVKLDGDIGILGNGAGLVMSTLDVVAQAGGSPANFLDAGGGSNAETIKQAVDLILANPAVKAVLVNIFGGITRGDEVATGLITAFEEIKPSVAFVVRIDGTNDVEGRRLLQEAALPNVYAAETMNEAADMVVALAAGQNVGAAA
jgi:succinyl-CoA synthetase beta subunit